MTGWTEDELSRISQAAELLVATRRLDGSLRRAIPIWQVRMGDPVHIRSAHGVGNSMPDHLARLLEATEVVLSGPGALARRLA